MADKAKPEEKDTRPRFAKWIDDTTAKIIAQKLNVTVWTVYGWRKHSMGIAGGFRPDPVRLGEILSLANGALVAADVYPPRPEKKKRKKT